MKYFISLFILFGIFIFSITVFLTHNQNLSKENLELYNKARDFSGQVEEKIWEGFEFDSYPIAFRQKNTDYVLYNNEIITREPILPVAACTAQMVDNKVNVFMLSKEDMDTFSEFAEGFSDDKYILSKLSIGGNGVSNEEYICILYHESFHAYQIERYNIDDFFNIIKEGNLNIQRIFDIIDGSDIIQLYKNEAEVLNKVFDSYNKEDLKLVANEYLESRLCRIDTLRKTLSSSDFEMLMKLEQFYETVEGTATYVSLKTAQVIGSDIVYNKHKNSLLNDFYGTKKYYNSGMALCILLDKLEVEWKISAFRNKKLQTIVEDVLEGNL